MMLVTQTPMIYPTPVYMMIVMQTVFSDMSFINQYTYFIWSTVHIDMTSDQYVRTWCHALGMSLDMLNFLE